MLNSPNSSRATAIPPLACGCCRIHPRRGVGAPRQGAGSKGVKDEDISINYTAFGHGDWQTGFGEVKKFGSADKKTAVVSTIDGDANVPFYKELAKHSSSRRAIPQGRNLMGSASLDSTGLAWQLEDLDWQIGAPEPTFHLHGA